MTDAPPCWRCRPARPRRNHATRGAASHASRGGIHFVRIEYHRPSQRILYTAPTSENEFGALLPRYPASEFRAVERRHVCCRKLCDQRQQVLASRAWCDIGTGDRFVSRLVRCCQNARDKNPLRRYFVIGCRAEVVLWRRWRRPDQCGAPVANPAGEAVRTTYPGLGKHAQVSRVACLVVYPVQQGPATRNHAVVPQ